MVEFITPEGEHVDLVPNQELSLSIENAMFSNDRIPVAWSTDVELPISSTNSILFGYIGAMLLPEQRREINVSMYIDAIPAMTGKLKLTGSSEGKLQASFVGVSIEDSLSGNLQDAPFARWEFGSALAGQRPLFDEIMEGAAQNTRDDFALPLMVRDSEKDTADNYVVNSEIGGIEYEDWGMKYLNSPKYNFVTPVVKLAYILRTSFSDVRIDELYSGYFEKIGIVAPYRKNSASTLDGKYNLSTDGVDGTLNFVLDLADAMPDVSLEDFVKNMLAAFCATIFIHRGITQMKSNQSIIQDTSFIDWSQKISDSAEIEFEDGQIYEYGFSGVSDDELTADVKDYDTIADCLGAPDDTLVHCLATGDIYRKIQRPYISGHGSQTFYANGLDLARQDSMIPLPQDSQSDSSLDTFSATSNWVPVKCIPYVFNYSVGMLNWYDGVMLPIVEDPTVGGIRPTTVQFGLLQDGSAGQEYVPVVQFTSNGYVGTMLGLFSPANPPLNLTGENGLYERFHKDFQTWLAKDKTVYKVDINLSAADIANLQLWRKIMLFNRLFFIKTLSITLNTTKNYIRTEADLVSA